MKKPSMSAQDLILALREKAAMSDAEIGRELGRDPSQIRKVRLGEKPGHNLTGPLSELHSTGTVTRQAPRRLRKDGQLARVRAPKGKPSRVPLPQPPHPAPKAHRGGMDDSGDPTPHKGAQRGQRGRQRRTPAPVERRREVTDPQSATEGDMSARFAEVPKRGRFEKEETVYMSGGGRRYKTNFPKTKTAKGRAKGWGDVEKNVRSAARKTWGDKELPDKRVSFDITYADGRKMRIGEKGGYSAQDVKNGMESSGGLESWLKSQGIGGRYQTLDTMKNPIVSAEITVTQARK